MSHQLLIPALLLVLLLTTGVVHLSNPESEIVQDSSEEAVESEKIAISEEIGGSVRKAAPLQLADDNNEDGDYQELAILNLGRYPDEGRPRIKVLRPITTSTGVIWRELETVYSGLDRLKDRSVLYRIYSGRDSYSRTSIAPPKGNNNNNVRRPPAASAEPGDRPPIDSGPSAPEDSNRPSINNRPGVPEVGYRPYINNGPNVPVGGNRPLMSERPGVPGGGNRPSNNDGPGVPGGGNRPFINNGPSVPQRGGSYGYAAAYTPNRNPGANGNANSNPVGPRPVPRGQGTATSGVNAGRPGGNTSQGGNRRGPPPSSTHPNRGVASASPDSNFFAGIINNFAFKLADRLNPQSNFIFSPVSAFVALALCYMGSEGRTRIQLARALGLDENSVHGEHLHTGIRDLMISMSEDGSKRQVQALVASGLFYAKNFSAESSFVDQAWRYYRSELHGVDFANPDTTLATINQWVSRNTRGAIPTLVDKPPSAMTRLLLLNAVYFKGQWKTQFPSELTFSGEFRSSDGTTKQVPMMSLYRETFPFYRSDEHRQTFVKLPYAGELISMIIALPYSPDQAPLTSSVKDQTLCHVMDAMEDTELDRLYLPRFRLEDVSSLRRTLVQMGVSDIFDRQAVDLRRLRRQNDIFVSAILQKGLIEVDEQGTTAAAVTGVRFVPLTSRNPKDFIVDRPFSFYVVHEPSGLVLFFGKVTDLGTTVTGDGSGNDGNRGRMRPRPNTLGDYTPGNNEVNDNNNNDNGNKSNENDDNSNDNKNNNDSGNMKDSSSSNNNNNNATSFSRVRIHGAVTYQNTE